MLNMKSMVYTIKFGDKVSFTYTHFIHWMSILIVIKIKYPVI
jgi:hypothetical protein